MQPGFRLGVEPGRLAAIAAAVPGVEALDNVLAVRRP